MIEAAIFDMDGLLIDSEPYWRQAESKIFGKLCVAPSEEEFERMMGNQIGEVIRHWHNLHPWESPALPEVEKMILGEVAHLVKINSQLMPGAEKVIRFFKDQKIPIALASSSPLQLILELVSFYGIGGYFNVIKSAEHERYGKPHPAVFISTAEALHTEPARCLVFEDSFNGVLAAKSAKMKCIAVPAANHFKQTRFDIADFKLRSLVDFSSDIMKQL
ncbi:MAG TPA: hexitol phosphatase HxpB [Bacteroidia bacterium]|nr:hexitol phosphatase HxpB [Bacteroidia bacterium]